MTVEEIEQFAQEVLLAHELEALPVDPYLIARLEKIALLPGRYDDCFDGRIEYHRRATGGRFVLFYAEAAPRVRPEGRVRFSVAHELGHFYLPQHRQYLVSGLWHGSRAGFVSEKPLERQADYFAAALLMPRSKFMEQVRRKNYQCSLADLGRLAEQIFQTSLLSTAMRYVELDVEPCCVVLSRAGHVAFTRSSDELRRLGLGWIDKGSRVPPTSVTVRKLKPTSFERVEGGIDSDIWFEDKRPYALWEEAINLGYTGLTLTFLACAEDQDEEGE